jgi:hypothetical protein
MTTTQTSFSAFAAIQTDPGNFAVSDQSGLRGCFFPQPLHDIDPHLYATGEKIPFDSLRDDFHSESVSFGTRGLDATNHIACGSVWPCSYAGGSWGNCSSVRARTFA